MPESPGSTIKLNAKAPSTPTVRVDDGDEPTDQTPYKPQERFGVYRNHQPTDIQLDHDATIALRDAITLAREISSIKQSMNYTIFAMDGTNTVTGIDAIVHGVGEEDDEVKRMCGRVQGQIKEWFAGSSFQVMVDQEIEDYAVVLPGHPEKIFVSSQVGTPEYIPTGLNHLAADPDPAERTERRMVDPDPAKAEWVWEDEVLGGELVLRTAEADPRNPQVLPLALQSSLGRDHWWEVSDARVIAICSRLRGWQQLFPFRKGNASLTLGLVPDARLRRVTIDRPPSNDVKLPVLPHIRCSHRHPPPDWSTSKPESLHPDSHKRLADPSEVEGRPNKGSAGSIEEEMRIKP